MTELDFIVTEEQNKELVSVSGDTNLPHNIEALRALGIPSSVVPAVAFIGKIYNLDSSVKHIRANRFLKPLLAGTPSDISVTKRKNDISYVFKINDFRALSISTSDEKKLDPNFTVSLSVTHPSPEFSSDISDFMLAPLARLSNALCDAGTLPLSKDTLSSDKNLEFARLLLENGFIPLYEKLSVDLEDEMRLIKPNTPLTFDIGKLSDFVQEAKPFLSYTSGLKTNTYLEDGKIISTAEHILRYVPESFMIHHLLSTYEDDLSFFSQKNKKHDKTALVIGCSDPIGYEIASSLSSKGYNLILLDTIRPFLQDFNGAFVKGNIFSENLSDKVSGALKTLHVASIIPNPHLDLVVYTGLDGNSNYDVNESLEKYAVQEIKSLNEELEPKLFVGLSTFPSLGKFKLYSPSKDTSEYENYILTTLNCSLLRHGFVYSYNFFKRLTGFIRSNPDTDALSVILEEKNFEKDRYKNVESSTPSHIAEALLEEVNNNLKYLEVAGDRISDKL